MWTRTKFVLHFLADHLIRVVFSINIAKVCLDRDQPLLVPLIFGIQVDALLSLRLCFYFWQILLLLYLLWCFLLILFIEVRRGIASDLRCLQINNGRRSNGLWRFFLRYLRLLLLVVLIILALVDILAIIRNVRLHLWHQNNLLRYYFFFFLLCLLLLYVLDIINWTN